MWQEDQHEANLRSSDLLVRVLCLAGSKRDDQFADIVVLNDKLRLALGVGFLDVTQRGSAPYEVALLICTMNVQCKPCIELRTGVLQSGAYPIPASVRSALNLPVPSTPSSCSIMVTEAMGARIESARWVCAALCCQPVLSILRHASDSEHRDTAAARLPHPFADWQNRGAAGKDVHKKSHRKFVEFCVMMLDNHAKVASEPQLCNRTQQPSTRN